MLKAVEQAGLKQRSDSLRLLYDRFGAKLMGYLNQTLHDSKVAEECLVACFTDWLKEDGHTPENCTWLQLLQCARSRMHAYRNRTTVDAPTLPANVTGNKIWRKMTSDQQLVFYNAYHCSKPIAAIAAQLNKPEDYIRKTLVAAFAIIRKS